ncbi:P-loop containing nucleoside triphosphate hydrolase protein [Hypoxylon sp. NC1633]|nr:P-loop containing nucleoside triphosphate hydrolase protein [Hypoxylon sp. NC1633]
MTQPSSQPTPPRVGKRVLESEILRIAKTFLSRYLKIDGNRITAVITIFDLLFSLVPLFRSSYSASYGWIQKFFTSSISVSSRDDLHGHVRCWITAHILKQKQCRFLQAYTKFSRGGELGEDKKRGGDRSRRKASIEYQPPLRQIWFMFERCPFIVTPSQDKEIPYRHGHKTNKPGDDTVHMNNTMTITSLGRSPEPIKRFLQECRAFSDRAKESSIVIRSFSRLSFSACGWEFLTTKAIRRLDTVHLDEDVKATLISDIEKYLDPKTRAYYRDRNIPYRRGYLLHGPPGTGKTSLSMALAGEFGLDLYMLDLTSVPSDEYLDKLFRHLPSPSLVLLEDIDAVGLKKRADTAAQSPTMVKNQSRCGCTLSGLLNALDGVASSEGRILLMTSNMPSELDSALLRPGRIDRKIYLGHINRQGAEQMFQRMFRAGDTAGHNMASDGEAITTTSGDTCEDLAAIASRFAGQIPQETFTPAQIQEYLLRPYESATDAADKVADWVAEEMLKKEARAG